MPLKGCTSGIKDISKVTYRTNVELSRSLITSIYELYNRRNRVASLDTDRVFRANVVPSGHARNIDYYREQGYDYAREISRRVREEMRQEREQEELASQQETRRQLVRQQKNRRRLAHMNLRYLQEDHRNLIPRGTDFLFDYNDSIKRGRLHYDILPSEPLRPFIRLRAGRYDYNVPRNIIIGYILPTDVNYIDIAHDEPVN